MAITKFTQEIKVGVPAKRMFKAMVTESYTILPKAIPNMIKSLDILQGDGGPGTIRLTNLPDGAPFSYLKHRIDAVDKDNCTHKFALIEGPVLGDVIEFVNYEQKFEDTSDGGCIINIFSEYHTKGDIVFDQEDIKKGKEKFPGFYKHAEKYLLENPEICA